MLYLWIASFREIDNCISHLIRDYKLISFDKYILYSRDVSIINKIFLKNGKLFNHLDEGGEGGSTIWIIKYINVFTKLGIYIYKCII